MQDVKCFNKIRLIIQIAYYFLCSNVLNTQFHIMDVYI